MQVCELVYAKKRNRVYLIRNLPKNNFLKDNLYFITFVYPSIYTENYKNQSELNNPTHKLDENFLKVHPDIAALFREVKEKELAVKKHKAKKIFLKEELKATKKELKKRLAVLESWRLQGEIYSVPSANL